MAKLGKIHLGNISYDGLPLSVVLMQLSGQCKLLDPEHKGINFLINNNPDRSGPPAAAPATVGVPGMAAGNGAVSVPNLDPSTGLPMTPADAVDVGSFIVKLPNLSDVRLADVLDAIVLVADHPIKYSVQDFAIVFSAKNPETPQLSGRTFRVDPNTFSSGLENVSAKSFGAVQNNGSTGGGAGGGQNQNNGAVVGVVNAFGGTGDFGNTGQGVGGGGRLDQAAPASEPVGQMTVTFRLNDPKPEAELKTLLSEADVNLPLTRFIYNAKVGVFAVRGAPDQLALVNRLVLKLNGFSPQEIQANEAGFVKSLSTSQSAMDESTNLFMRTFRVDPYAFYSNLVNSSGQGHLATQTAPSTPSTLVRDFCTNLGLDLSNPPGKSVFFSDKKGYLFVKATKSDLDTIERAIQVLNQAPPQLHIKARFYEVPNGTLKDLGKYLNLTIPVDGKPMGILTSQNASAARQALELRKNIEVLGEPEITTLSGRQTQMRATEMVNVVTNVLLVHSENGSSSILPQTNCVEIGPDLNIFPNVLADGYTINLVAMGSLKEFLGYDGPTNSSAHFFNSGDQLPKVSPKFRNQQIVASVHLWDDQTLVLGGLPDRVADTSKELPAVTQDKELLVFITVTIVDSTGARVHSDDEMPFAQNGVPTQPERKMSGQGSPVGDFPPYHNGDPFHPDQRRPFPPGP